MKHTVLTFAALALALFSCDTTGVKKEPGKKDQPEKYRAAHTSRKPDAKENLRPGKIVAAEEDRTGIEIKWFEQGKGELLKDGEVVKINYDVRLEDGTLVDGNQLLNKDWLPFLVGYGIQTKGWDIAFRKLRVGDFVEIVLPGNMARGEKGVKGIIPPNAVNIIHVRILGKLTPTKTIDGTKVWLLEQNESETKRAGEESTIDFHYMVGTASNPKYDISYRRSEPFTMKFSDFGIVRGLKKALLNAKRSDKIWILVPASEAYGDKGLVDLVKPGENVFYDVFIMDVR